MAVGRPQRRRLVSLALCLLPLGALVLAASVFARPRGPQTPRFQVPTAKESSRSPAAQRLRAGAAGANLIVILADAACAERFTSLGYQRNTTPNIARLFDDSILLTEAYSTASNTKASVASLFTSQFPDTHGTLSGYWSLPTEGATLAECMGTAGYTTAGFAANPNLAECFGFNRGFRFYDEVFRRANLKPMDLGEVDGSLVLKSAVDWLRAHKDERFFAYIHFLEPHFPYRARRRFREQVAGPGSRDRGSESFLYDATLAYLDSVVGQLVKEIAALGLLDKSVVVFSADHGEAFGEHGFYRHGSAVYREMVHVPLAVHLPPRCGARPRRASEVICLTDLMPTLLDLLQIGPPKTMQGRTRLGLLAGEEEETPGFAVSRGRGQDQTGGAEDPREVSYALRVPRFTLVLASHGRRVELYDRDADPGEQHNLAGERRDLVKKLRRQFEDWASTQRGRPVVLRGGRLFVAESKQPGLDEKTRRKLRALGYLR